MNAFEKRIVSGMSPMEACLDLVPDGTITDAMEECKRLAMSRIIESASMMFHINGLEYRTLFS